MDNPAVNPTPAEAAPGINHTGGPEQMNGSKPYNWKTVVATQTVEAARSAASSKELREVQQTAAIEMIIGIAPKDEVEAMIASQLIAVHNAAMECYRRGAGLLALDNLSLAGKLSRTYVMLLDALNRRRGTGQQKITVEHLHLHSGGGQAAMGVVETRGGGVKPNLEGLSDNRGETDVSRTTLRSEDKGRDAVPVPGDAERPLPVARRQGGGSEGEQE
jgi:hypothetical protein